jgi:uncharacterized membrane protein
VQLKRIARHLLATPFAVRRVLPPAALAAIEGAIGQAETTHSGEIRFAVEAALDAGALFASLSARERALQVFAELGVWDTERNNGVLIYLLLADHDVEIVADRGIAAKVGAQAWEEICHAMEAAFAQGRYEEGVIGGVQAVASHLALHFPPGRAARNELPDKPVVL